MGCDLAFVNLSVYNSLIFFFYTLLIVQLLFYCAYMLLILLAWLLVHSSRQLRLRDSLEAALSRISGLNQRLADLTDIVARDRLVRPSGGGGPVLTLVQNRTSLASTTLRVASASGPGAHQVDYCFQHTCPTSSK